MGKVKKNYLKLKNSKPDKIPKIPINRISKEQKYLFIKETLLGAAVLVLIVFIAYLPVILHGGFVWDDDNNIINNAVLKSKDGIWKIWFHPALIPYEAHYWPLVYTVFWIEYHLWGTSPLGYHLINILLHAVNTLLLWVILRRLAICGGFLAAAIFALHPVHVESAAWIVELKDVLSGMFYLLAFLIYTYFVGERKRGIFILSIFFFICAMLSKSIAVSLPFAIVIWLWWEGKLDKKEAAPLTIYFIIALIMAAGDLWYVHQQRGVDFHLSLLDRFLIAGRSLWFYAEKLAVPFPLMAIYPKWEINPYILRQYIHPLAAIAVFLFLWFQQKRCGKGAFAAVLFFAITLAPILGFVEFIFMQYSYVADRFQYLASIGLIILFSSILTKYLENFKQGEKWIKHTVRILLLSILGILTWQQGNLYKNKETLFLYNLSKNPNSPGLYNNLGVTAGVQGDNKKALFYLQKAIQLDPDYADGYNNLGNAFYGAGNVKEAERCFQKALQIRPDLLSARTNLGVLLLKENNTDEAIKCFIEVLKLEPENVSGHLSLGVAFLQKEKYDDALPHISKVLEIDPGNIDMRNNLGLIFLKKGQL